MVVTVRVTVLCIVVRIILQHTSGCILMHREYSDPGHVDGDTFVSAVTFLLYNVCVLCFACLSQSLDNVGGGPAGCQLRRYALGRYHWKVYSYPGSRFDFYRCLFLVSLSCLIQKFHLVLNQIQLYLFG